MEEKILLVEDEEKLARMVELELRYEGYQVDKSFDGRSGLERARPFGTRQPAVLHRAERGQNEVHAGLVSGQHHENVIRPAACQHLVDLLRRRPFAIYHPLVGIASYDGFHLPFESGIVHVRRDEDDVLVTFEKRAHLLML